MGINTREQCIDDLILYIDADLSVYSFMEARDMLAWYCYDGSVLHLVTSPCDTIVAGKISKLFDVKVSVDNDLEDDVWFLYNKNKRVYSPGA